MDKILWDKCAAFHGHECPGLAIGVRCTLIAAEELGVKFPVSGLRCVKEKDMCGCDAVRCITECTEDNGLLTKAEGDSIAFSYILPDGRGVRVEYIGASRPGKATPEEKAARIAGIVDGPREGQFVITTL